ncbi:MAG: hypothetical protein HC833_25370 [Leptolyngbyaceae cyanobacterium RM1_406_9]|nr:hypothetical protein [Leptolyngbyaceae cyanobacterium RM1_406_9]
MKLASWLMKLASWLVKLTSWLVKLASPGHEQQATDWEEWFAPRLCGGISQSLRI